MSERMHRLRAAIERELSPVRLEIIDESAQHAGHAGTKGVRGGETHFAMLVVSPAFAGLNRVQRSRKVHAVLAPEFASGLHALSLTLLAPEEERKPA